MKILRMSRGFMEKPLQLWIIFTMYLLVASCHSKQQTISEHKPSPQEIYISEAHQVASGNDVKDAFQTIIALNKETRDNHILLNEIPAPPFKEEQRAKSFMQMMKQAGADSVWMDSIGNVLALRTGVGRKGIVVVDGHLDTVFPEGTDVVVKHRGDTLYAPGISDNARSLSMMLTLMKVLNTHQIRTASDILFVGSVGEEGEGDLRGVKYLFEQMPHISSFISIDIGGMGNITHQAAGSLRYKITFHGPGGHSWGDFGIVSPHFAMVHALSDWDIRVADYIKGVKEKTTYSVGVVGGGTSVNSIPFESWVRVDIRSEKEEHLHKMDGMLQSAIRAAVATTNAAKKKGADLQVSIDKIGDRPAGLTESTSPLVQRAMATAAYFGIKYDLRTSSTNSNLPMSLGVPAVTLGQGGKSGGIHSLDEWWLDENGDLAIQYVLLTLMAQAGYVSFSL